MNPETLRDHLEAAAMAGDVALVKRLAKSYGAQAIRLDAEPEELTTLHHAAAGGSVELISYLLSGEVAADPRAARNNEFTPLHAAAMNGHTEACRLLLDAGASINAQTRPQGYAPLHSAAFAGHVPTVALLLERGADARLENYRGETPAATARRTGQQEAAEVLARAGGA